MTGFDDRKNAFETKFARDADFEFRVTARRNKLVGLWAAKQLGMTGDEANVYAATVVAADFEKPGDGDVVSKLHADLKHAGIETTEAALHAAMAEQLVEARRQLTTAD